MEQNQINSERIATKSEHLIVHHYLNNEGTSQTVRVKLVVDYQTKKFDVLPNDGTHDFKFKQNSHQLEMWKATTLAIHEAIVYGTELLNLRPTDNADKSQ